MVSPVLTEGYYTGAFMVSEAPGYLSRDNGFITNSGTVDFQIQGGQVLTQALVGAPTVAAVGTIHGNGGLGTTTAVQNAAITGVYTLIANSATQFAVIDPNGVELSPANVGTAYADAEIGFQITAGSTAFAALDTFSITVPAGNGYYASFTGAAGGPAVAIAYDRMWVPAGTTKPIAVIARNAEVNASELQWDPLVINSGSVASIEALALAALRTRGIVAR